MTKRGTKKLAKALLVVVAALASASCAPLATPTSSSDAAPTAANYAVVVQDSVAARASEIGSETQARAADNTRRQAESARTQHQFRRISQDEITQPLIDKAVEILNETRGMPLGTTVTFELEGETYLALTEHHYREPGSSTTKPCGLHRGVSMFVQERV